MLSQENLHRDGWHQKANLTNPTYEQAVIYSGGENKPVFKSVVTMTPLML